MANGFSNMQITITPTYDSTKTVCILLVTMYLMHLIIESNYQRCLRHIIALHIIVKHISILNEYRYQAQWHFTLRAFYYKDV